MKSKYNILDEEIIKLHNSGMRPTAIRKLLGIPKSSYLHIRRRLNLESKAIRSGSLSLDNYAKEMLIGTILGDSHITKGTPISSNVSFAHCTNQKGYFDYKVNLLRDLKGSIIEHNYYDKRTNKSYKRYCYSSLSFKELKELRNIFYKNGKKIIPIEYIKENFTAISLAYLYMDDGSTQKYNTTISTMCFQKENLEEFAKFLKDKFEVEFTVGKNNVLRVVQKDADKFRELIIPEISKIPCMYYKLQTVLSKNSVKRGNPVVKQAIPC